MKSGPVTFGAFASQVVIVACSLGWIGNANAGLFDDEEARRAILDLRQRIEASSQAADQKLSIESKRSAEENTQLRQALIELQNQLEASRAEIAKLRGQSEQIARDVAEMQRKQKDDAQALNDRLRKLEPAKVTWDGREFLVDPSEKRDFESAMASFRKGDFARAQWRFVTLFREGESLGPRDSG